MRVCVFVLLHWIIKLQFLFRFFFILLLTCLIVISKLSANKISFCVHLYINECVYFNDKRNNFFCSFLYVCNVVYCVWCACSYACDCVCFVCFFTLCVSFFRLTYTPVKQHKCEPFTLKLYDVLVESLTENLYQTCTMYYIHIHTHTHSIHILKHITFPILRCLTLSGKQRHRFAVAVAAVLVVVVVFLLLSASTNIHSQLFFASPCTSVIT